LFAAGVTVGRTTRLDRELFRLIDLFATPVGVGVAGVVSGFFLVGVRVRVVSTNLVRVGVGGTGPTDVFVLVGVFQPTMGRFAEGVSFSCSAKIGNAINAAASTMKTFFIHCSFFFTSRYSFP
jgi:hypothetical protein